MRLPKNNLDYTTRDYEGFRTLMIQKLQELMPEYTDTRQSDAGIVIIELQAMALDILSYYLDSVANECFLITAEQRSNVMKFCKMLGYTPKFATAAKYSQIFERTNVDEDLTIPAGTRIKTKSENPDNTIYFSTLTDLTIKKGHIGNEKDPDGNYLYAVDVIHGLYVSNEELTDNSDGSANQTYSLNYAPVLVDNSFIIYVSNNSNNSAEKWDRVESFAGSESTSKVYMVEVDDYNSIRITFGDNSFGLAPPLNSTVTCSYYVGGGEIGNVGSNTITEMEDSISVISKTYNVEQLEYGYDNESTESIKANATMAHRNLWGALTCSDFSGLTEINFKDVICAESKKASEDWTKPEVDDIEIYILTYDETQQQGDTVYVPLDSSYYTNLDGSFQKLSFKIQDFFNSNTDYVEIESGKIVDAGRKLIGVRNIIIKPANMVELNLTMNLKLWDYYSFETVSKQIEDYLYYFFKLGNIKFGDEISLKDLAYNITNSTIEGIRYLSFNVSVNKGSEYCTITDGDLLVPKIGTLFTLVGVTSKEIK